MKSTFHTGHAYPPPPFQKTKQNKHESTLHRGHRLCGVEIFHTQIGRCFQLILLSKCDYLAFVYYVESTYLIFYTFCSGPSCGYLGASIALLNEQDNVSYVFTPYSSIKEWSVYSVHKVVPDGRVDSRVNISLAASLARCK